MNPPPADPLQGLLALLEKGQDGAPLRFGIGSACLRARRPEEAIVHLLRAVALDPGYSAAWKLLGTARLQAGDAPGAREAWTRGVGAATQRGDAQAAREMGVLLRRLDAAGKPEAP